MIASNKNFAIPKLSRQNVRWLPASFITAFYLWIAQDTVAADPEKQANHQAGTAIKSRYLPPLLAPNYLPTTLIYGIPGFNTGLLPTDSAYELTTQISTANTFIKTDKRGELLILDGEVRATTITLQWRFHEDWQSRVIVPHIAHTIGIWDDLITDWHHWFGLPQGRREEDTNGQFSYTYRRNDDIILNHPHPSSGIGDTRIAISRAIPYNGHQLTSHIEIKAPTGNSETLTGSGAWDWSAGVGWERGSGTTFGAVLSFATLNITYLGKTTSNLSTIQKRKVISARGGLHWHALDWMSLTAQLDGHSPLYDSSTKALGGSSLQLTLGGRFFLTSKQRLDLSIGEDLNTKISPDFVVNMALSYRF